MSAVLAVILGGFLVVGGPFLFFGAVYLRRGLKGWRERRVFQGTETTTVGAISRGDVVRLVGTAEVEAGTLEGAFSGEPALASEYEVLGYDRNGDSGGQYRTVHEASDAVRFRLVDGTGSVVVDADPDCVTGGDDHEFALEVGGDEELPDRIRQYVERTGGLDSGKEVDVGPVRVGSNKREYREASIRPGDEVVVYGRVARDPEGDWGDSLVVIPEPGGNGVLTNLSLDEIATRSFSNVAFYLVLGGAMLVGPFAVLAAIIHELGGI